MNLLSGKRKERSTSRWNWSHLGVGIRTPADVGPGASQTPSRLGCAASGGGLALAAAQGPVEFGLRDGGVVEPVASLRPAAWCNGRKCSSKSLASSS